MTRGDFMIRGVSTIPGAFMIRAAGMAVLGGRPGMTAGICARTFGMPMIVATFGMPGRIIDKALGTSSGIECALARSRSRLSKATEKIGAELTGLLTNFRGSLPDIGGWLIHSHAHGVREHGRQQSGFAECQR